MLTVIIKSPLNTKKTLRIVTITCKYISGKLSVKQEIATEQECESETIRGELNCFVKVCTWEKSGIFNV